jgi:hypothetical protein
MAEKIAEFPGRQSSARPKYPWDSWCDGDTWKATRPNDYECSPRQFQSTLHAAAVRRNLRVETTVHQPDTVIFRFFPRIIKKMDENPS